MDCTQAGEQSKVMQWMTHLISLPIDGTADDGSRGKVKLSLCLTKHHAMKTYRGS
jgi:hypothetical protein